MEDALIQRLLADSGLSALVNGHVFPGARPQGSGLPAVVVFRVSGAPLYTDDGETGLSEARVQIDCWGETYTAAKRTARAVTLCLSGFVGTQGNTEFAVIMLDDERDEQETGSNAAEYLFCVQLDFIVWFKS